MYILGMNWIAIHTGCVLVILGMCNDHNVKLASCNVNCAYTVNFIAIAVTTQCGHQSKSKCLENMGETLKLGH